MDPENRWILICDRNTRWLPYWEAATARGSSRIGKSHCVVVLIISADRVIVCRCLLFEIMHSVFWKCNATVGFPYLETWMPLLICQVFETKKYKSINRKERQEKTSIRFILHSSIRHDFSAGVIIRSYRTKKIKIKKSHNKRDKEKNNPNPPTPFPSVFFLRRFSLFRPFQIILPIISCSFVTSHISIRLHVCIPIA